MAEIAIPRHHRHTSSIGSMTPPAIENTTGPVELLPNPDFSFPMQRSPISSFGAVSQTIRPASMQLNARRVQHDRQRKSVSALPTFSFNAEDTTGLTGSSTPPLTPSEDGAATSSRRGHRRGVSEFIGGDSRFGMSNVMSTSPTKATHTITSPDNVQSTGPPHSRRGHAHRRSAAMSSHDVSGMMVPAEGSSPSISSASQPVSPLETVTNAQTTSSDLPISPGFVQDGNASSLDTSELPTDESADRPPSRARVGFSENVEYIPRPLSTISSGTESSMSTIQGHSVNNSINSLISLSNTSPPSMRIQRPSLSTTFEDNVMPRSRSSIELSKRIEREGQWLKGESTSLKRPLSESATSNTSLTFAADPPATPRMPQKTKHTFGFDRRRSEPAILLSPADAAALSNATPPQPSPTSVHSQDGVSKDAPALQRKSSTKKIKAWAVSKMSRKSASNTKLRTAHSEESVRRSQSESAIKVAEPDAASMPDAVAETDLDAVFGQASTESQLTTNSSQPRIEVSTPSPSGGEAQEQDADDMSPVVDLDAAMGPYGTPAMSWESRASSASARRQLHSSRMTRDFAGSGMHYHRRTESAPALAPFEPGRSSIPTQPVMADVFEEDEEDSYTPVRAGSASGPRPQSHTSEQEEGLGVGIQVVDAYGGLPVMNMDWGVEEGLGIQSGWTIERPTTSHGRSSPRLSTPIVERRASSIMEETIMEEVSPVEPVQIVEDHEEPRFSSTTKSSDSSETPTLVATSTGALSLDQPDMTPESYSLSAFSSPDFSRRQTSFDTSRLGTSASSMTDNRTMSSFATGDATHEPRTSSDDVPSLTSSRSTMMSTAQANGSRRNISDRSISVSSGPGDAVPDASAGGSIAAATERRRKRSSIASLSHLVGGSFSGLSKIPSASRPQTAFDAPSGTPKKKKEHRLSKLMFWKAKHPSRQSTGAN